MKITKKETVERTVEITPPYFWRNPMSDSMTEMIGLIDDKTVVTIFDTKNYTKVVNGSPAYSEVETAFNKWNPITEEQFMQALNTAIEKLSLMPVLNHKF